MEWCDLKLDDSDGRHLARAHHPASIRKEPRFQRRIIHNRWIGHVGDICPIHVAHKGILNEGDLAANIQSSFGGSGRETGRDLGIAGQFAVASREWSIRNGISTFVPGAPTLAEISGDPARDPKQNP